MKLLLTFLYFSHVLTTSVQCLNILVWATTIGRSHITFMGGLGDIMSQDGHNVTMIILKNDPDVNITGTEHVQNIIRFESPLIESNEWSYFNFKQSDVFFTKTIDMGDFFKMQSVNSRICRSLLDDENLMNYLKNGKFDLAVVEFFHFCPAGIFEIVGIKKVILATALGMTHAHYELLNMQVPLSYVPAQMTHLGSKIPFFGRLYNIAFFYVSKFCYNLILFQDQYIFREKYGWGFPNLEELYKSKIDYVFTNTNEFTESTRPTLQMIKYIGGSTTQEPEKLDDDFESILSVSSRGTVLFSLGSLLKPETMPDFIKTAFLEAFEELPEYTFIWKSSSNNNFSHPNIFYRDWVPQVDLLADERVKAFITHSGMNSVQEALFFGVPIITLPIFADQDSNAVVAQERGYAYGLNKFRVTKDDVLKAIKAVLGENDEESSYTSNARQASRILKGSRESMRNEISRLVYLSGSTSKLSHLRINTDHLNVFQYYNIDVYFSIIFSLFSAFYVLKCLSPRFFTFKVSLKIGKKKKTKSKCF